MNVFGNDGNDDSGIDQVNENNAESMQVDNDILSGQINGNSQNEATQQGAT